MNDTELLDVLESMNDPEQVMLDQELENIYEAEQSLLFGDDEDIESIVDLDTIADTDDFDDDIDEPCNVMESSVDEDDVTINEQITDNDLFDEYGVINY